MFGHDENAQVAQSGAPEGGMSIPDAASAPAAEAAPAATGYGSGGFTADSGTTTTPAEPAAETVSVGAAPAAPVADAAIDTSDEDLIQIKQQALQQLSPLVGHLEQTPEEKFRTTMMMIQASDNQGLIKEAYSAAQEIEDEKTRAQALLDIVNEINYFTQHQA
jgi:hypothetical protein